MYRIDMIGKDEDGHPHLYFDVMVDIPTLKDAKRLTLKYYFKYGFTTDVVSGHKITYFRIGNNKTRST